MRPALTRSAVEAVNPKAAVKPENSGAAVRAKAAKVVQAVRIQGRSLTDALADRSSGVEARDEPLLGELSYGTLRLLPRLESLADLLLQRPIKRGDQILRSLLLVGLYQLVATRVPDHAAVSATVAAARQLRRPHAAGLINATLRRFQRDRAALLEQAQDNEPSRWLMPSWLLRRLRAAWPDAWEEIVAASNDRAPMFLRLNLLQTTTEAYLQLLEAAHVEAHPLAGQPGALMLRQPISTSALPGFAEGLVSVQDAGAQWAARLLNPSPGERILDACAAPGGKTGHLLELAEDALDLTAVDVRPDRLEPLRHNLQRLGLHARVHAGDAAAPDPQWAAAPFQRILLDAPCSATGVIRRHPDIKQLRRDGDIAALATTQAQILDALWKLLAPGGRLLYVTCSVLPDENEKQVAGFLARTPDARELALPHPVGTVRSHGRQLLPRTDGGDGFYFALLKRSAPAADAVTERGDAA
jgi:16S rRNA (cytosine967-C5)-methyltransferase